jgi:hypothetical protein
MHIIAPVDTTFLSREEAVRILDGGRAEVLALIDRLPLRALSRSGLGGGTWSPKDLLGHLESWEEHALRALEAWSQGKPAPIDTALRTEGLTNVNRAEVEWKAHRSARMALGRASMTHARLLTQIAEMSDARWRAPATRRGRLPLGHRLGQILAGTREPFRHDEAHLKDLRAFVEDHGA